MFLGRNTAQKMAIARVLRERSDHPCASEIHRRVRQTIPNISLATVYRNLESMASSGFLTRISGAGEFRYDANTEPHHHFFCLVCKTLSDVPVDDEEEKHPCLPGNLPGYRVTGYQLLLYGRCPGCREEGRGQAPKEG